MIISVWETINLCKYITVIYKWPIHTVYIYSIFNNIHKVHIFIRSKVILKQTKLKLRTKLELVVASKFQTVY